MSDASTLPPEFYNVFGIDSASFQSAFQDSGNEMFSLRPGWSLGFTHAVLTTGDKPKTVASVRGHPLEASAAGEITSYKILGDLHVRQISLAFPALQISLRCLCKVRST
ncbi:unnamed protein product [Pocillopora meandrina]|uniref:Uncharacterized protein n=1 Tax=Pocillopora meandrina TaxID=46732 RepID=A0AAU9VUU7_9CNID|nr:unnamed protein product [Pocillopora meandrina]